MTIEQLLAAYREYAIVWGQSSQNGTPERGNAAQEELDRIRNLLRQLGPKSSRKLLTFLHDKNLFVRLSAGIDALGLAPNDGERVLAEIASGPPSMARFEAEMTLKLWRSGEFQVTWWTF